MAFETQNSIKNEHCLAWVRRQPWETTSQKSPAKAGALRKNSCLCNPISGKTKSKSNSKEEGSFFRWKGGSQMPHPRTSTSTGPFVLGVDFISRQMDGRIHSSPPVHASPSLIVNSVNEVNLINFRAGSHMTFSSIFSPTSKTSISSSKMERREWQSPITLTYLKLRVNLFSRFECVHYNCIFKEDLQIAKKLNLSPRNVQKLHPPFIYLFLIPCLSLCLSGWDKAFSRCIFFHLFELITTLTEVETT